MWTFLWNLENKTNRLKHRMDSWLPWGYGERGEKDKEI